MRPMVKNEDIDKWIEFVKDCVGADERTLTLKDKGGDVSPDFEKIEERRDCLLKLQEFLEKSKVDYRIQPPNYIARLLHRSVIIHLFDGEKVEGVVDGFNNYEIRIKTDKIDLLIQKHAIKFIEGDFSRQDKAKKVGDQEVIPSAGSVQTNPKKKAVK